MIGNFCFNYKRLRCYKLNIYQNYEFDLHLSRHQDRRQTFCYPKCPVRLLALPVGATQAGGSQPYLIRDLPVRSAIPHVVRSSPCSVPHGHAVSFCGLSTNTKLCSDRSKRSTFRLDPCQYKNGSMMEMAKNKSGDDVPVRDARILGRSINVKKSLFLLVYHSIFFCFQRFQFSNYFFILVQIFGKR